METESERPWPPRSTKHDAVDHSAAPLDNETEAAAQAEDEFSKAMRVYLTWLSASWLSQVLSFTLMLPLICMFAIIMVLFFMAVVTLAPFVLIYYGIKECVGAIRSGEGSVSERS